MGAMDLVVVVYGSCRWIWLLWVRWFDFYAVVCGCRWIWLVVAIVEGFFFVVAWVVGLWWLWYGWWVFGGWLGGGFCDDCWQCGGRRC